MQGFHLTFTASFSYLSARGQSEGGDKSHSGAFAKETFENLSTYNLLLFPESFFENLRRSVSFLTQGHLPSTFTDLSQHLYAS